MFVRLKRVPNILNTLHLSQVANYAGKRRTELNSIYIREKHARNGKVQCDTVQGGKVAGRVERYILDIQLKMEKCEGFTS